MELITILGMSGGCGICEGKIEPKEAVGWPSPSSRVAHSKCFNKIKEVQSKMFEVAKKHFSRKEDINWALKEGVSAVRKQLNGLSIIKYLEMHGVKKLQEIFDNYGVAAVRAYSTTRKPE